MKETLDNYGREVDAGFAQARDTRTIASAVMTFHRRLDEVIAVSVRAHAVQTACTRGCHYCCHLPVEVQPAEALALATWLRRRLGPAELAVIVERLRENAARTRTLGPEERQRTNIACALLAADGTCRAYEARPAQCRRFHSTRLATCEASFANPADDTIESPEHPAVRHNASVIIALARESAAGAGLDATTSDLQGALLEALENPKAERRFRDGKKTFLGEWRRRTRDLGLQLAIVLQDVAVDLGSLAAPLL